MSSHAERFLFAMLAAASLFATGCYEAHPCGDVELCNFRDDDCDGLVDEDFVDEQGRYTIAEHCGGCGIDCRAELPTAETTTCEVPDDALPFCAIVACPENTHLAGTTACVPDAPALCLPCTIDDDCALRLPGSLCLGDVGEARRCGEPCDGDADCTTGFVCSVANGQCEPASGECACTPETVGATLGCRVVSPLGDECAGVVRCEEDGVSECEAAFVETCNEQDDDCDGNIDEDFRDEAGLYVSALHCGECARPCVPPGPNMVGLCSPDDTQDLGVRCDVECAEGFVDVDGLLANGCECLRWDGEGPPPALGGDIDCDGVVDDDDEFVFVAANGNDTGAGTLIAPKRTLAAAAEAARLAGKDVLVSRGVYEGFTVIAGVSVFGGYSPDFRARDLELYPVLLENTTAPGAPALVCRGVREATRLEGLRVQGSTPTAAGEGSTAVYLDDCGSEVVLADITIVAARATNGTRGASSSDNLDDLGLTSLTELDGLAGGSGRSGNTPAALCIPIPGGSAGAKTCGVRDVSGGAGGGAACAELGCQNGESCANAGCTDFTVGGVCDIDEVLSLAVANPAPGPGLGEMPGAAGELSYNSPTNRGVCFWCDDNPTLNRQGASGKNGAVGLDGTAGEGCFDDVSFDNTTGRASGGGGSDGEPGTDGSGGGGGSAGSGYAVIGGTEGECGSVSGGSGGGGGSGGCGAPRASAGTGGGHSLGVAIRLTAGMTSGPSFSNVRVITASGGDGGDGGIGASGGNGANGGNGGAGRHWCARLGGQGGQGGSGGAGGGGGGGCGGDSHGVLVFTEGTVPEATPYADSLGTNVVVEASGIAGRGGRGGYSPGNPGTAGGGGSAAPIAVRGAL